MKYERGHVVQLRDVSLIVVLLEKDYTYGPNWGSRGTFTNYSGETGRLDRETFRDISIEGDSAVHRSYILRSNRK